MAEKPIAQKNGRMDINRRRVISTIGGGIALGAIPTTVGGEETEAGQVRFIEVALTLKEDFESSEHIPLPSYHVDDGVLYLIDNRDSTVSTVKNSEIVAFADGFEALPATLFNDRRVANVPTKLTDAGLSPAAMASLSKPMTYPSIRARINNDSTIELRAGNQEITLSENDEKIVDIGNKSINRPPKAKGGPSREQEVSLVLVARNHGLLNVKVYSESE